jgi:hypothetical protein
MAAFSGSLQFYGIREGTGFWRNLPLTLPDLPYLKNRLLPTVGFRAILWRIDAKAMPGKLADPR